MITPGQIRGARAMLGISQAELAKLAEISTTGLNNIENGNADPKASTLKAIQSALETAGIIFVPSNGEGPGVRMRKTPVELSEKIADLHEALPVLDDKAKPSPHKAMKQLEHAHVKNEIAKAKSKHAKLTTKGTTPKS